MFESTDDLRIAHFKPLIPPAILMEELPVSEEASHTVAAGRRELDAILIGADDRLAVVVGPCSIHDSQAALEYGERLQKKAADLRGELCVVMRVYFEKPRTTVGWKGLINDPHLDDSFDINSGLRAARGQRIEGDDFACAVGVGHLCGDQPGRPQAGDADFLIPDAAEDFELVEGDLHAHRQLQRDHVFVGHVVGHSSPGALAGRDPARRRPGRRPQSPRRPAPKRRPRPAISCPGWPGV